MNDLVARLRNWFMAPDAKPASDLMDEAANEIERLRGLLDSSHQIGAESLAPPASGLGKLLVQRMIQAEEAAGRFLPPGETTHGADSHGDADRQ